MKESDKKLLGQYLPAAAVEPVAKWIVSYKIHFTITRSRRTKLGDYRPPIRYSNHRITINHNLNPYAFLITFIHELAHLQVYKQYKNKVLPHGKQWRETYRKLMLEMMQRAVFPADVHRALEKSIVKAKASSSSEMELTRVLMRYDEESQTETRVEDLPPDTVFITENGMRFRKGEKQRTRYKCLNLQNNRVYTFHPLTPVREVK